MTDTGSGDKFAQRTFSNMATEIAYVLVATLNGLFMVPFFKDELGLAAYAIIPLATSVTAYVTVMSDSFSEAVNRFFIISLRKGDHEDSLLTFNTSVRAMLKLSVVALPIMAIVAYVSPYVFSIGDSSRADVQVMFLMTLWSTMIFAFGTCFNNTFMAENKMTVINALRIFYLLSQIVMIVVFFATSTPSLVHIGVAYLFSAVMYSVFSFALMRRNYPFLKYRRGMNDPDRLKNIGNLSGWSIVNKVGSLFFLQASLIITNIFLGVEAEGHLSFVTTMVSMVGTSCMMFSNVFSPHFYDSYASDNMVRMANISRVGISFVGMVIAMPLAYVCVFSPQILTVWVGASEAFMSDVVWIMFSVLTLHYALYVLTPISTIVLKARPAALQVLFCGILNIVLTLLVVMFTDWGLKGVALAWVASMSIRSVIAFPMLNASILKTSLKDILVPQWKSMALFVLSAIILYGTSVVFEMPSNLLVIAIMFLVLFAIYLFLAARVMFTKSDREEVSRFMPSSVSKIFRILFR